MSIILARVMQDSAEAAAWSMESAANWAILLLSQASQSRSQAKLLASAGTLYPSDTIPEAKSEGATAGSCPQAMTADSAAASMKVEWRLMAI
jgi:hypothetical protein